MQDGAHSHIANPVKQLLKGHFVKAKVISHHFLTAWLPRIPDLKSMGHMAVGLLEKCCFQCSDCTLNCIEVTHSERDPGDTSIICGTSSFSILTCCRQQLIAY
ncbi:hypothetical protein TNCV_4721371 [Trichonephila clavipes]|uniref:Uncharacterized protein n=1 Tax=Trichonephila clavipes TaxID=2585209 RepID=A0A8X6W6V7_TRICX|nr:hypothetical protein TNCV_4721371 [Trichonephila clavipes]